MNDYNNLTKIENKVLQLGEIVGDALANDEEVDLIQLACELYKIYSEIGDIKDESN